MWLNFKKEYSIKVIGNICLLASLYEYVKVQYEILKTKHKHVLLLIMYAFNFRMHDGCLNKVVMKLLLLAF